MNSVFSGVQGALLLARGRPEGVRLITTDHTAAIRSFWAIPLSLPAVVCLKLLDWVTAGVPAHPPLALGRYLLLFLVGWLLFVWLSHHLATLLHRQSQWPRFVAIWAYCSIIENTMVAIGALPGALGAPVALDQVCALVTVGWALWLEWYAIRLSLVVGPAVALMLLVIDFSIGVLMSGLDTLFS